MAVALSSGRSDRGASDVLGYTILVGIVSVAVIGLFAGAVAVQDGLQEQITGQQSTRSIRQVDNALSSLSASNNQTTIKLPEEGVQDIRIEQGGSITITVNGNSTCSVTHGLSSLRYENKQDQTVVYQSGGIFKKTDDDSWVVSEPAFYYRNGTIDLTFVNLTGSLSDSEGIATLNTTGMGTVSTNADRTLFQGTCSIPQNVTIEITSDLYQAWASYARSEFPSGTTINSYSSNETVRIKVGKQQLPAAVNDTSNDVVNLSDSSMVTIDTSDPSITVDKADDTNDYYVRVVPITGGMQVARTDQEIEKSSEINVTGVDVVMVLDDSGSMDDDPGPPYKIDEAKDAAQLFIENITSNAPVRIGIVGFDNNAEYYPTSNGKYLSDNADLLNASVDELIADGGTNINDGLRKANNLLDLKSNATREQYIILLSDGKNNPGSLDDETIDQAEIAARNNITIYTIRFGSGADDQLMKKIARKTGGKSYFADSKQALKEILSDIRREIGAGGKQIVHPPVSVEISSPGTLGETFRPQIPGDTGYVANYSQMLNVNDPLAPPFYTTFTAEDEQELEITVWKYGCDKWETTGGTVQNQSTGDIYYVVRCSNINESAPRTKIDGNDVTIYRNGENASKYIQSQDDLWWEKDLTTVLDPYTNDTDGDGYLEFTLDSNQAIIAVDLGKNGRMLLLYEMGKASQNTSLEYIIDVSQKNVTVSDDESLSGPPDIGYHVELGDRRGGSWQPSLAASRRG